MLIQGLRGLQRSFRARRMRDFALLFGVGKETRILDVGGTPEIWETLPVPSRVVLLNLPQSRMEHASGRFLYVDGDGCRLPFADGAFDLVFSNSVIEHVGSPDAQRAFAREVMRVGRSYWVQTPNRYFPVETHMLTPLVHLLPRGLSRWCIQRFTVWAVLHRPSAEQKRWYVHHFLEEIRLLSRGDMQELFPDAAMRSETFLFFKKSWFAVRKAD